MITAQAVTVLILVGMGHGFRLDALSCPPSPGNSCTFGEVASTSCPGYKECAKGPGEVCGGLNSRFGVCADGLACSNCYRCVGCSFISFSCYDDINCYW